MGEIETPQTHGSYMAALHPHLTHCSHCDAVYQAGNWVSGYYERGTSGIFQSMSRLPDDKCPMCLRARLPDDKCPAYLKA